MTTAAEAALGRVLAVFDLLIDAVDEDALVPALLPMLLGVMPGDSIVWTPHGGPAGPFGTPHSLPAGLIGSELLETFSRGAAADPLVRHTTTGSGVPARRSDLHSRRDFHALALYGEVYRPLRMEHQLAMAFPAGYAGGVPRQICVCVNRGGGDFTDADVAAATMLRARLGLALDRLARLPPPAPPDVRARVTRREGAVLALLAEGLTNEQIAHRLAISPRTVDKHLEHAYHKLGVGGRVGAANAWLAAARG